MTNKSQKRTSGQSSHNRQSTPMIRKPVHCNWNWRGGEKNQVREQGAAILRVELTKRNRNRSSAEHYYDEKFPTANPCDIKEFEHHIINDS